MQIARQNKGGQMVKGSLHFAVSMLAALLVTPASAQDIGDDTARYFQRAPAAEILVVRRIVARCQEAGDTLNAATLIACTNNFDRWKLTAAPAELTSHVSGTLNILKDLRVMLGLAQIDRVTGYSGEGAYDKATEMCRNLLDRMDQLQIALDRAPRI